MTTTEPVLTSYKAVLPRNVLHSLPDTEYRTLIDAYEACGDRDSRPNGNYWTFTVRDVEAKVHAFREQVRKHFPAAQAAITQTQEQPHGAVADR